MEDNYYRNQAELESMTCGIKLRHWNPERKVMTGGLELITILLTTDGEFVKEFQRCGMIWLLYTGFKDSTGKEIYESDIIEFDLTAEDSSAGKEYGVVKFTDGGWCTQTGEAMANWLFEELEQKEWKPKVVGNIYQNPELLNS